MFIDHDYIEKILDESRLVSKEDVQVVINKAKNKEGLNHKDVAILLQLEDKDQLDSIYKIAGEIKESIYGKRIVMFAPLYVSNHCINNCLYCGYRRDNKFERRKLTQEEIKNEVKILESMGHKRLALEVGEDPVNVPIDYILECIDTIYKTQNDNGEIRRINVNIAATTVENYRKLKNANIGTYILFQETYHKPTYEKMHPKSIKGDYNYHLTSFDRAMEAGIDDVGAGVLFGLADPKFEVLALMLHNEHLEEKFNVGFHTISVPRLKKAEGMNLEDFPNVLDDETFKKIVAIIRIAVPFTGIILSTRENQEMRRELLRYGVSQISAGSVTGVGGYKEKEDRKSVNQFETCDDRSPLEVLKGLVNDGYIPSYCTACYRKGRTGERFMSLAKTGQIQNVCEPNALMSLVEYALDYGDDEIRNKVDKLIDNIKDDFEKKHVREMIEKRIERLRNGERDLYV
ncbi:thiamine biosynthesis protein ThiH [Candidatus Arthromitus sp. SFB-mouse-Japan]|uniref:[FeFe] hydrogenase H-cluster radical SAM maturase HydG n=1 Tax=Candidatus Arthromitus sp. SFB-mouse TaxID=49118 RepID=UPI00021B7EF2|nr:[FeFe] hydrogenase H-cluster radical SAM maturase HydG [Candidatus Arthromitus sp. SFB-mouse]EIA25354.1 ThiH protein [Candidatus Arthromitus sp. SFB-3]EIA26049.1 ThiH protein [Candidatus Arthromitus sp. SFB-4]EIA27359.1 ThiH protein [Candidatus Arthromitus sp. SFB-co]EIA30953.1 ThiH protein [Candidatus Arthromitus sp. SFB-mouse-SU]EIA31723.1 ThiH protein [Candidatus Arthromitus sp. SFB-5]